MESRSILNLIGFLRLKITIIAPIIASIGYLLFNEASFILIPVILAGFFVSAGTYSYNSITDKKEDLINKKKLNPIVSGSKGVFIVTVCFILGFIFSLFLSVYSILICLCFTFLGIAYSFFRLKQYFLVKNFYTGLALPLIFLLGAFANQFVSEVFLHYFVIAAFIFMGTLVSDLRDYTGDKNADIKTVPVVLGILKAKVFTCCSYIVFMILVLLSGLYSIFIFIPFCMLTVLFLAKNKPHAAHTYGGFAFISWLILLIASGFI